MKKVLEYKGQIYDVYVNRDCDCCLIYTIFKVKRPNNKRFFRSEFFHFKKGYLWFKDLKENDLTIEQGLCYAIEKELQSRKELSDNTKMWNEFCAN